jgi:GH25 family lysozyme M1 (1,4-beta-N-acetylmuramidase)
VLGIDVHPYYQASVDWRAVADHSAVEYVWVKVSDGGAAYTKTVNGKVYRPDTHVAGAKSVGIPVGGYHYAQLSPSAEAQANVLSDEVRRLGATSLPPALDLEDPWKAGPAARDFAIAFLKRLQNLGHPRVAIYANTGMFSVIRPDLWDIPGLVIWAADYGPNDGVRHPDLSPYPGRADVHQYTSNGHIAGIAASVDLNESLTPLLQGGALMALTDQQQQELYDMLRQMHAQITGDVDFKGPDPWGWESMVSPNVSLTLVDFVRFIDLHTVELAKALAAVSAKVDQLEVGGVNEDALADKVADRLAARLAQ